MNDSQVLDNPLTESAETQFSHVLQNFRLANGAATPFDLIDSFIDISVKRSLAYGARGIQGNNDFTSWDLETKLWHLVKILYSFRLAEAHITALKSYSSLAIKKDEYLSQNPSIKELQLIIEWLQFNSASPDLDSVSSKSSKWLHTKLAIQNSTLNALANPNTASNVAPSLDADAPLRSGFPIKPEDTDADSANYIAIYRLLLIGDMQKALDIANETGNFTLALIILGARHDFVDPVLDGVSSPDLESSDTASDTNMDDALPNVPSGLRHKLLWLQSVYKLSLEPGVSYHERLIYTFLCGGDTTENIKFATSSWEECLLVYLQQVFAHKIRHFLSAHTPADDVLANVVFPSPQQSSISTILNTLLRNPALDSETTNPFRVIMGSVMIDELGVFLHKSFKSPAHDDITSDPHILRLLCHLSVFLSLIGRHEGAKTPTRILVRYISHLSDMELEELVPTYVSFIPDEKDARECYSLFLSSITNPAKRSKQLEIFRALEASNTFDSIATPASSATEDFAGESESKLQNVLKRTVERVMLETEDAYSKLDGFVVVEDENIDPVDIKLYRAVDWLYDKEMHEDAITATRVIFRRFLLTGRLKAIKEFSRQKNFRNVLKNYDLDLHTKSMGSDTPPMAVSEEEKEELLQYSVLVDTLTLLDEWKHFVYSNSTSSAGFWKSKDFEKSIEKTINSLETIIRTWFSTLTKTCDNDQSRAIFKEYRTIYIPYFIVELLQVLEQSRYSDWKYMRKAFLLVSEVANDKKNDFLSCFINCGRLNEFVSLTGKLAIVASERGMKGIFA